MPSSAPPPSSPPRPGPPPPGGPPPHDLSSLCGPGNSLASHYTRFRVGERLLLTGHSHQAWPDVARDATVQAFDDAAAWVDGKWDLAGQRALRVRDGFRRLLDDPDGHIALAGSTHDVVVRFLSALPWQRRRRLLTSDGEFHTLRRQLDRLAERDGGGVAGIAVAKVAMAPVATLVPRLIEDLQQHPDDTAAVLLSTVSFEQSQIVPHLRALQEACEACGAILFLDAYHHLNVAPFSVKDDGLGRAYITGGGYKYCQLGEGACFLRFPHDSTLRPLVTGWFAEFGLLAGAPAGGPVSYGEGPARFAGATYDPVSHYRAAAVFDFFLEQRLDVPLLRAVSQHQVGRLAAGFDALGLDPALIRRDLSVPLAARAGFLALPSPHAGAIVLGLRARGVAADSRGDVLRLGPAPYLADRQINDALVALGETVAALR